MKAKSYCCPPVVPNRAVLTANNLNAGEEADREKSLR